MVLKVYYDLMSQPCRALYMFLKLNKVPFEECEVKLRNGEHLQDEFKQINPFQRVPSIDHDGFKLAETIAIMRYLCTQYKIADHWYPADIRSRARIDEYMAWQHLNLRIMGSMLFRNRVMAGKKTPNETYVAGLDMSLNQLSDIFLRDSPFIGGQAEISFADLMAVCEIEQPIAAGFDVLKDRPKLVKWKQHVSDRVGPLYEQTHRVARVVRLRLDAGKL